MYFAWKEKKKLTIKQITFMIWTNIKNKTFQGPKALKIEAGIKKIGY